MKKTLLVRMAVLLLLASSLPGCLLVPVDDGPRGGRYHDNDRGDRHRDRGVRR